MQRTLSLAAALGLGALVLPAGVSSTASSAAGSQAHIALLERPAGAADRLPPAVAKRVDTTEVDVSTIRLGSATDSVKYYVAQGTRGLCLIRVDDPVGPLFTTTCASTLIAGGVYLGTLDRAGGSMQVADIVPDDVTRATVDGTQVGIENNLLVTGDIPLGATVEVIGSAGAQRVPLTAAASLQPAAG